jgi:hypothetical protein
MIALTIQLLGILTLGAALTAALVRTTAGESQLRAKALAAPPARLWVMRCHWISSPRNWRYPGPSAIR